MEDEDPSAAEFRILNAMISDLRREKKFIK
jgi:hypothetical protein